MRRLIDERVRFHNFHPRSISVDYSVLFVSFRSLLSESWFFNSSVSDWI